MQNNGLRITHASKNIYRSDFLRPKSSNYQLHRYTASTIYSGIIFKNLNLHLFIVNYCICMYVSIVLGHHIIGLALLRGAMSSTHILLSSYDVTLNSYVDCFMFNSCFIKFPVLVNFQGQPLSEKKVSGRKNYHKE